MIIGDPSFRAQLRCHFEDHGIEPDRAAQTVDLACQAADAAFDAFSRIVDLARHDEGLRLMVAEAGAQLARDRFDALFQGIFALGDRMGAPQFEARIGEPS